MTTTTNIQATAQYNDLGRLLLRLAVGGLILLHGISKLSSGIGFVADMLAKFGLPAALGNLVYIGEIVAPVLIMIGLWTRPAALVIVINMLVAVLLVHTGEFFTMSKTGGWALELQGMYFIGALVVALLGAGRYSVGGAGGKWN